MHEVSLHGYVRKTIYFKVENELRHLFLVQLMNMLEGWHSWLIEGLGISVMMTEGIGWEESHPPHCCCSHVGSKLGAQWINMYSVTSKSRSSVLR
jgi:hypothetical protein